MKTAREHEHEMSRWYTERSGPGSTVEFSALYRSFIECFVFKNGIKSVCDLGCGDAVIASHIDWQGAAYLGIDVIPERVKKNREAYANAEYNLDFEQCDLRIARPHHDLVLVKDVIQHWPTDDILDWLASFVTGDFKYALITNCNYGETVNTDIQLGGWRAIDLTKPPFSVGQVVFSWGTPNKDVVLLQGMRE